jgi:hypothetical protein
MTEKEFRKYFREMADPHAEQKGIAHLLSREVRDNARVALDALTLADDGVPPDLVRLLTRTATLPDGLDAAAIRGMLE